MPSAIIESYLEGRSRRCDIKSFLILILLGQSKYRSIKVTLKNDAASRCKELFRDGHSFKITIRNKDEVNNDIPMLELCNSTTSGCISFDLNLYISQ